MYQKEWIDKEKAKEFWPDKKDDPEFLTIIEFANKIRMHPNTVRKGIISGRIQAVRLGNSNKSAYRIPATELQRLCELDMSELIEKIVEKKMEQMKPN